MEPTTKPTGQGQSFNSDFPVSAALSQEQQGFVATPREATPMAPVAKASIIKTLESDAAISIQNQNESKARMVIAEQRRQQKEAELLEQAVPHNKKILFIIVSSICVLIGIAAIIIAYMFIQLKNKPVEIVPTQTIVPTDSRVVIDVTKKNFDQTIEAIQEEITKPHTTNTIHSIGFQYQIVGTDQATTTYPITTAEFLHYFLPQMPEDSQRSFNNYVLGSTGGTVGQPFLFLTTEDYGRTFNGMLNYENTAFSDIQKIFNLPNVTGTSTPVFSDSIFQNRDIRILTTDTGTTILVYAFLDKNTLVITSNIATLQEIYTRFITGQFK